MAEEKREKIGIMADSHGHPEAIAAGAVYLNSKNCTALFHLGDICDSTLLGTADDCVTQMKKYGIKAVKGNNDHPLAANAGGQPNGDIGRDTLAFLADLPLMLSIAGAKLVHSRPFIRRLGLSAMIGVLGQREADVFFRENPDGLMFRGHSHRPEIICRREGEIQFSSLGAGQRIELTGFRPCIITCGALTAGWTMIWEPVSGRLACCRFS
jgi:predicted phosphodiesterase